MVFSIVNCVHRASRAVKTRHQTRFSGPVAASSRQIFLGVIPSAISVRLQGRLTRSVVRHTALVSRLKSHSTTKSHEPQTRLQQLSEQFNTRLWLLRCNHGLESREYWRVCVFLSSGSMRRSQSIHWAIRFALQTNKTKGSEIPFERLHGIPSFWGSRKTYCFFCRRKFTFKIYTVCVKSQYYFSWQLKLTYTVISNFKTVSHKNTPDPLRTEPASSPAKEVNSAVVTAI